MLESFDEFWYLVTKTKLHVPLQSFLPGDFFPVFAIEDVEKREPSKMESHKEPNIPSSDTSLGRTVESLEKNLNLMGSPL